MEKNKDDIFKAFTAKAVQRLKDKKVTKYETFYMFRALTRTSESGT